MTSDRRLIAARPDLAASALEGQIKAENYADGTMKRVIAPFTALRRTPAPDGAQETQLLFGEDFCVYEDKDGFAWGQSAFDSYVGYIASADLGAAKAPITHRVKVLRSYIYPSASIKVQPLMLISLNSRLSVTAIEGAFARLESGGFIRADHLAAINDHAADYVAIAEQFLHSPYHWGGRTSLGLDCSGLVTLSLQAAGIDAPRDADQQQQMLGHHAQIDLGSLQRGDLMFWNGHVGIMTSSDTLLHATGHSMLVVQEPIKAVCERIEAQGNGKVSAVKRF